MGNRIIKGANMNYLKSKTNSEKEVTLAKKQILKNGLELNGGTGMKEWSNQGTDLNGTHYILNPVNGWGGNTCEQMMKNVENMEPYEAVLPKPEEEII
jgi:hypothetical protein